MRTFHVFVALLLFSGSSIAPNAVRAAESYDNCTGYIEALPATISSQGVWCLHHDLATAVSSGNAIEIAANNVTIDCNDFAVDGGAAGSSSSAIGIHAMNRQNAVVRRCLIRGFKYGIQLAGSGGGHLVEDNHLENNLYTGINAIGAHNRIRRNAVYDTGGAASGTFAYGISATGDIVDNTVDGVFTAATSVQVVGIGSTGMSIQGNRVAGLSVNGGGKAYGITAGGTSNGAIQVVSGNRISATNDGTSGEGIHGATWINGTSANLAFCRDNTVSRFATAMANCVDDGGNGLH